MSRGNMGCRKDWDALEVSTGSHVMPLLSDRRVDLEIKMATKGSGLEKTSELPNLHEEPLRRIQISK